MSCLASNKTSVAVGTLVRFIPLTNPILSFQQFVNKKCMTYSDLGASKKIQYHGLLIEPAFPVHLLCARYVHLTENTNINNLWSLSLRISQFKVSGIFVDSSSTYNDKIQKPYFNNNKM